MRIFVSGATGFVGRHLVRALVQEGDEVKALVRPSSDAGFLRALGVETVLGDLTDYPSVKAAVAGCEVAYNLAVARRTSTPRSDYAANVAGTEHVLRAVRGTGVRHVVHCSTVAVYGRLRRMPADETTPFNPEHHYPLAKAEAERIVLHHVRTYGISAVIARPSAIYGPGDLRNLKLFRDILSGRLVTIGDCRQPFQGTYVDDVVQGLRLCGQVEGASGQAYLLAGERPRPLMDLLRAIADAGGVELRRRALPAFPFRIASAALGPVLRRRGIDPPFTKLIQFFTWPRAYDISKARRELGFQPSISLEEGVRRTLAWYRATGHLPGGADRAAELVA